MELVLRFIAKEKAIVSQVRFEWKLGVGGSSSCARIRGNNLTHPERASLSDKDKDVRGKPRSQRDVTLMDDDNDAWVSTTELLPGRKIFEGGKRV